jgi:hypothetical protein
MTDQIMCFVDEIEHYMECQQREQARKLTGKIPTVAQYWDTRLGTSAVPTMLALMEYAHDSNIPRWIMTHPKMRDLWREINFNQWLSNDMLSLRKEIVSLPIFSSIHQPEFNLSSRNMATSTA